MKKIITVTLLLFAAGSAFSQENEFSKSTGGLMYPDSTVKQLKHIVDSLNLKFKTCDLQKVYRSKRQGKAHFVTLDKKNVAEARKDMDAGLPFEQFITKYPEATVVKELLVVRSAYTDYEDKPMVEYSSLELGSFHDHELHINAKEDRNNNTFTGKWVYKFFPKTDYSTESVNAFYFVTELNDAPLPEKYARMVQYADCMVDTTAQLYFDKRKTGEVELPPNYASLPMKEKQELLHQMRSTRVMGFCSMDQRPRIHAMNIAILAAETVNWEVFLRAHLDIMNDRFERMSDGSYAWKARQTYIRELEVLDIGVQDLLLGISLRIENPGKNHYYGSIGRLGRALSETANASEIENKLLEMIADNQLDDYNRVLMYYLFVNYNHYLEDKTRKTENETRLKTAVAKMPEYIASKIEAGK